ncbi:MAG: MBL fold metallo-hydrolase [Stomatobaculum sp.]|nr:MBL fold metallo-hydrolase [Stomatobaculum sp.]
MIIEFIGADHEVTGSCHYINVNGKNLLVDYGMEQGRNIYENVDLPVPPSKIDFLVLTHAHIDHTGLLPLLYKNGFRGRVVTTPATRQLCQIMLRDTANIQLQEAEWKNRKAQRAGAPLVEPLYTMDDAVNCLNLIESADYEEKKKLDEGITMRFTDVGHLLGSASVELWLEENGISKKIVFSGDIGNTGKPLIRDPEYTSSADYVVMESTYGNRLHDKEKTDHVRELAAIMQETFDRGGNVVMPAFAVGRTQELLYFLRQIREEDMIKGHPDYEVWVDSPLALEATEIFQNNLIDCFNDETQELVRKGVNPIAFEGLRKAVTADESKAINALENPKVIISAAGMCDAGRIRHHLKHNLWRPESTVVFAGYQAYGTLGRVLQDGADSVKLFGESIEVNAKIANMHDMSSHADRDGLDKWIMSFQEQMPVQVFVVHGEDSVTDEFCAWLKENHGIQADAPFSGAIYDLAEGKWLRITEGIPISKETEAQKIANKYFADLEESVEMLRKVVQENAGGTNKDLRKFAEQIRALCEKWSR